MSQAFLITGALVFVIASAILHDFFPSPPPKAVGMDLGTTFSCVAVFNSTSGTVDVLTDVDGDRVTPSVISFRDSNSITVGRKAKEQAPLYPNTTIFDVKRFIGREMIEVLQDTDTNLYPFSIVDKENKPQIQISIGDKTVEYTPETLSAIVLTKMKEIAEYRLGRKISQVVLAIPVEFNEKQRKATEEAGRLAGLEVLRTIYEPTAAAMAYGLHNKENVEKILVYDFGGGTLDVSLLGVDSGIFRVLASKGDKHLGGEDFNHHVMEHFLRLFKEKYKQDIRDNRQAVQQLRKEVERAKLELSEAEEAKIIVELDGITLKETLSRKEFEQLNEDLFQRVIQPVSKVLETIGITPADVDEIVLVGGSTRIPRVREELIKLFNGKQLNCNINPDEAVAHGTAIQAGILTDSKRIPVGAVER